MTPRYLLADTLDLTLPLVVPLWEDEPLALPIPFLTLDAEGTRHLAAVLPLLSARPKSLTPVHVPGHPAPLLLYGMGKRAKLTVLKQRRAIRDLVSQLGARRTGQVALVVPRFKLPDQQLAGLVELLGIEIALAAYRFEELKSPPKPDADPPAPLASVAFLVEAPADPGLAGALALAGAMGAGLDRARTLANRPGNLLHPESLAEAARSLAAEYRLDATVYDEHRLAAMEGFAHNKAELLLGVGMSSVNPPRLIVVEYWGAERDKAPLALIGKGITFDTGGVNVKPWKGMLGMHLDMSGAAAVLGALEGIAKLKLPVNVIGICAAAENAISERSLRPGDVVTALDGSRVEVRHTDAEGRLVLGDALAFAQKYHPAVAIDAATLTGSIVAALGTKMSGLFTADERLAEQLLKLSREVGEPCWRMPLTEEYESAAESEMADVANVGTMDPWGDAIAGAKFIQHFAKDLRWAHLDIASIDRPDKESGLPGHLASGAAVRLFIAAAQAHARGEL